jgi:hypothetical protein
LTKPDNSVIILQSTMVGSTLLQEA